VIIALLVTLLCMGYYTYRRFWGESTHELPIEIVIGGVAIILLILTKMFN
jgi:hypothetical protein